MTDIGTLAIHKETRKQLESLVSGDKMPHALLFLGKAGFNTLQGAISIAKRLLCSNPSGIDPCNSCAACLKSAKYLHPDLHFSFPVGKHKAKKRDKTTSQDFMVEWRSILAKNRPFDIKDWLQHNDIENSLPNINVEECNSIISKLSLKAFESDLKILIMWLPEYLNNEGNRLLKMIEEPADNTHIILVAEDSSRILNTILSRVQIIKFLPLSDEQIKDSVINAIDTKSPIDTIVNLAQGDLHKAFLLSEGSEDHDHEALINWLRFIYNIERQPQALTQWVEDFYRRSKEFQLFFLEYSLRFMHQLHRACVLDINHAQLEAEEKAVAEKILKLLDVDKIQVIIKELDSLVTLLNRNANMKIVMMGASIRIGQVLRRGQLSKLLYE